MRRLIDANVLYRKVKTECNPYGKPTIGFDDGKKVLELIDAAPTIEAEPVRHGRWIFGSSKTSSWMTCSICCKSQSGQTSTFSFCPNCGAEMRG